MKSFSSRALRIAVVTPEVGLRRRISSAIQARGRISNQFSCADDARPALERGLTFDLLIIAVSGDGDTARKRLHDAATLIGWPPTLLLAGPGQMDLVGEFMAQRRGNDFSLLSSSTGELECRLCAFLARESAATGQRQMTFGRYRFVSGTQQVFIDDVPVRLTRLEFEVALFLFRNIGSNVSRERLYQSVWNAELESSTRTIDAHVGKVRKALDLANSTEFVLRSIYRDGYKLDVVESPESAAPVRRSIVRSRSNYVLQPA
ncbi:MAG: winged helix-turn-helix domain-containing protein [Pseudomonadota bacterium]